MYINNIELVKELIICQVKGKISKELENYFIILVRNILFLKKYDYDRKNDIQQDCLLSLLKNYKNFNSKKYDNGVAYLTEIIKRQMCLSNYILNNNYSNSKIHKDIKFISLTKII